MASPAPAHPLVVKTIEDLLGWAPSHEAQVQAFWREQWKINARLEVEMENLRKKVDALQGRFLFFCGGFSFAGAAIPTVIFLVVGK